MQVTAKTKDKAAVTVEFNLPADLEGKRKAFGDDAVNNAAEDSIVISVQALMRRLIEKGKPAKEIQDAVSAWRPDVRTIVRQTPFERASSGLDKLTPEERKALLAKLQSLK